MATSCRYEFQLQHFGFKDASPQLFQRLQWTPNKWVFFVYRFFMASYVLAWFLYSYIAEVASDTWTFLSNWTEGIMVVYFIYAFIISIHAVIVRKRSSADEIASENLPWYYILNWLLFTVAPTSAFEITLFYAVLIAPGRSIDRNLHPTTFHIHVVNSLLFLVEIFMVAFPDRFLHFIYTTIYGLLYTIFLLILHFSGFSSAVYPQLDFAGSPGTAAFWTVIAVIVLPLALHSIIFGLYHLRAFIARKTVLKAKPLSEKVTMGNTNLAFSDAEK